jgi:hypothetical protein
MRALRELEPPSADEGFVAVERVPFARTAGATGPGRRARGGRGPRPARAGSARSGTPTRTRRTTCSTGARTGRRTGSHRWPRGPQRSPARWRRLFARTAAGRRAGAGRRSPAPAARLRADARHRPRPRAPRPYRAGCTEPSRPRSAPATSQSEASPRGATERAEDRGNARRPWTPTDLGEADGFVILTAIALCPSIQGASRRSVVGRAPGVPWSAQESAT